MKLSSTSPLVSIITLCHNQADIVERAIKSVLEQTYPNIQLVIVDDCSSDGSRDIIQSWHNRYPEKIKVHFNEVNQGHPKSMNIGYNLCGGELVSFCDGDDWYFPEKIEREVDLLRKRPDIDVVHSNFDFYTIDGSFIKNWATTPDLIPQGDVFLQLLSLRYPGTVHLRYELTSRKILQEIGFYDDRVPIWVDWDLRLRLAAKYKYGYVDYIGSAYTINPQGLTNVLKQETILKYLQFVVDKNKLSLKNYPPKEAAVSYRIISKYIQKLKLAVALNMGNHSFIGTLKFVTKYPSEIRDVGFLLNSCFGKEFVVSLSKIKKKVIRK